MIPTYLMGFDLSGGGAHCLLIDAGTGEGACVLRFWDTPVTQFGGLACALNTDNLWQTVGEASRVALQKTGISPKNVAGIAATLHVGGNPAEVAAHQGEMAIQGFPLCWPGSLPPIS